MIRLITNNALYQSTAIVNHGEFTPSTPLLDEPTYLNVTGGSRDMKFRQLVARVNYLHYVNGNGGMSADYLVITDTQGFPGRGLQVGTMSTYGTKELITNFGGFSQTQVGLDSADFVYPLPSALSNKYGFWVYFGHSSADGKAVSHIIWGNAFEFKKVPAGCWVTEPYWASIKLQKVNYRVREIGTFSAHGLTQTELDTLLALPGLRDNPVYLYDDTGKIIGDKGWHCVVGSLVYEVSEIDSVNDALLYNVTLVTYRLRQY